MSASTGSFWAADIRSTERIRQSSATTNSSFSATDSIADLAQAGLLSLPSIESELRIPGQEIASKLLQALKRPARSARTAAEELADERLNTFTHGLGFAMSAAGVVYLLATVAAAGGTLRMASCGIYGASLLLMYMASTFFHGAARGVAKDRFQLCDHVAIYLLIAGTYTPFLAVLVPGVVGYSLLVSVWALAAYGISGKLKCLGRLNETSPLPCLGLGWIGVVAAKPMWQSMPGGCIALILAGGVSYSVGVLFYCRDDKQYFHALWHLFVITGTALHFAAIVKYVAL